MTLVSHDPRPISRHLLTAVWAGFTLLLIVGIGAAVLRASFLSDLAARLEPLRSSVLSLFGLSEPNIALRASEVARVDSRFAAYPWATLLHVLPGGVLLALVPLQFSQRVRSRYREFHRWLGRLLLTVAWVAGLTGLFFGVLHPFAGTVERVTIGLIGTYFLVASGIALVRIRARRTAEHREWMIRTVAAAIGISTVRLVILPIDVALTPAGFGIQTVFLISIWVGWGLTLTAAEWWIRRTRPVAHGTA